MNAGDRLDHYEIIELLGAGGMGQVYAARDLRLNRPIALKVISPDRPIDGTAKARFLREAKAASLLNHPNIVVIHDVSMDGPVQFMTMEWIRGRTLAKVLEESGPLAPARVIRYAAQIASALVCAHEAGVIHRDLKPANIMLTEQGLIKVLDFGLAKMLEPGLVQVDDNITLTAMMSAADTIPGAVLGTISYMSPEQAEGKPLDVRSDIFSFGILLYELLTGVRPFEGDTALSKLTALLRDEPKPLKDIAKSMPAGVAELVNRCLRKNLADRYQSMQEVVDRLEQIGIDSQSSGSLRLSPPTPQPARALWIAGGAALALLAGVIAWQGLRKPASVRPADPEALTFDAGISQDPAVSLDGRFLAFSSDRAGEGNLDLWLKHYPKGEPIRLTSARGDEFSPDFSVDGSKVLYTSSTDGGSLSIVPTFGGAPRVVVRKGRFGRFSPDGKWISYIAGDASNASVFYMPAAGGAPTPVNLDGIIVTGFPRWAPDSRGLLALASTGPARPSEWYYLSLYNRPPERTGHAEYLQKSRLYPGPDFFWSKDKIFFICGAGVPGALCVVRVDPRTAKPKAEPQQLTFGTAPPSRPIVHDRDVIYTVLARSNLDIWSMAIDANEAVSKGPLLRVTQDLSEDFNPALTPDGSAIVFHSRRTGVIDLWKKDLETGREVALTDSPEAETRPIISHSGEQIAYTARRVMYLLAMEGGQPVPICTECGTVRSWTRDDSGLIYTFLEQPNTTTSIWLYDIASKSRELILRMENMELGRPRISPDGRWLLFVKNVARERQQIMAVPFRKGHASDPRQAVAITDGSFNDDKAEWSPDGRRVYFISDRNGHISVWQVRLDPLTKEPAGDLALFLNLNDVRNTLQGVASAQFDLTLTRARMALNLIERHGNIWRLPGAN